VIRSLGKFSRLKIATAMGAVAEWLILGVSAATEGYGLFSNGRREFVAKMVDDLDRPQHDEGAILSATDNNGVRHRQVVFLSVYEK
jgi:hypothetical protein